MLVLLLLHLVLLQRFAAVIMRIREPKTTALIFASGKMVCTGAKSEQDSKLAAKKVSGGGVKTGGSKCSCYCRSQSSSRIAAQEVGMLPAVAQQLGHCRLL